MKRRSHYEVLESALESGADRLREGSLVCQRLGDGLRHWWGDGEVSTLYVEPCLVSEPAGDDGGTVGCGVRVLSLHHLSLLLGADCLHVPTHLVGDSVLSLKTVKEDIIEVQKPLKI